MSLFSRGVKLPEAQTAIKATLPTCIEMFWGSKSVNTEVKYDTIDKQKVSYTLRGKSSYSLNYLDIEVSVTYEKKTQEVFTYIWIYNFGFSRDQKEAFERMKKKYSEYKFYSASDVTSIGFPKHKCSQPEQIYKYIQDCAVMWGAGGLRNLLGELKKIYDQNKSKK